MHDSIDFVGLAAALGTAVYAALGLDYLAIDGFGLSLQAVCNGAMLVALLLGLYIAIELLSGRLSKAE
jgi:hypothetical protein